MCIPAESFAPFWNLVVVLLLDVWCTAIAMAAGANKNLKYWARAVRDRSRARGSGSFERPRVQGRRRPHHGRLSGKNQGQTALLIYQTLDLLATTVVLTRGFEGREAGPEVFEFVGGICHFPRAPQSGLKLCS